MRRRESIGAAGRALFGDPWEHESKGQRGGKLFFDCTILAKQLHGVNVIGNKGNDSTPLQSRRPSDHFQCESLWHPQP